jgi:hypothetical protein
MDMIGFCDIESCSLVVVDRRFRGTYCFHHQDNCPDTEDCLRMVAK